MSQEVAEFLLARITEDEEAARACAPLRNWPDGGDELPVAPARVLVDCDAKRRIVWLHAGAMFAVDCHPEDPAERAQVIGIEKALRCLALSYADHPDYREEWRP